MKYTGRITLLLIVMVTTIGWMAVYYYQYNLIHWEEVYFNLPMLILAWFLGKRHDQATYYAQYDLLTSVYNRNHLQKLIPKVIKKNKNINGNMTIFIVDIDNFKEINDTYGHLKGDQTLQRIADIIKDDIRKTDVVGRLGGDEFFVALHDINPSAAKKIIHRWKENLSAFEQEMGIHVTISVGTASFPADGQDFDKLYNAADLKMYEYKNKTKSILQE